MSDGRDDLHDLAVAYLLGELSADDRRAFGARLATDAAARAEVQALERTMGALALAVPQVEPPARLRARVLEAVGVTSPAAEIGEPTGHPAHRAAWTPWLAAAASLIAAVALGGYAWQARRDTARLQHDLSLAVNALTETQARLSAAEAEMGNARVSLAVLTAPDIVRVDLAGQPVALDARGRAFWSRTTGVIFAATGMPQAPAGTTYQLWIVPVSGAPISAGLGVPDASGRVTIVGATNTTVAPAAFALTREPAGGVAAPTGDKYLIGLLPAN